MYVFSVESVLYVLSLYLCYGGSMSLVYVFEAKVISYGRGRYIIYPPREYQEKLRKLHGKKIKVIIVHEENTP